MAVMEQKDLTNEQIKRYKMTERELFEKYGNLSKSELKSDFCNKSLQRRKRETKEVQIDSEKM